MRRISASPQPNSIGRFPNPKAKAQSPKPQSLRRRLVRSRVEAGGLEVPANIPDDRYGFVRQGDGRVRHQPIDVVDAKPDAFEVECADGAVQRFSFFNQSRELILLRHPPEYRKQVVESALRRLAVFCGHVATL